MWLQETSLTLSTVYKNKRVINWKRVADLESLSFDRKSCISLPPIFTREIISANRSQIPTSNVARQCWDHLKDVANQLPRYQPANEVSLLIGNNVPCVTRPREVVAGNENEPYAQRFILGWGIIGTICRSAAERESISHRVHVSSVADYPFKVERCGGDSTSLGKYHGNAKLVYSTKAKEVNPAQVKQMFEVDFTEHNRKLCELSVDDRKFVDILTNNISQKEDGHYVMPLPLKPGYLALSNNRDLCLKRLRQLKRRFLKNSKFKDDYVAYMKEVLEN